MQAYATLFLVLTLIAVCFIDDNIQPFIARIGRISLAVFGTLFVITEAIALIF
jgi:hypothetical protein